MEHCEIIFLMLCKDMIVTEPVKIGHVGNKDSLLFQAFKTYIPVKPYFKEFTGTVW